MAGTANRPNFEDTQNIEVPKEIPSQQKVKMPITDKKRYPIRLNELMHKLQHELCLLVAWAENEKGSVSRPDEVGYLWLSRAVLAGTLKRNKLMEHALLNCLK